MKDEGVAMTKRWSMVMSYVCLVTAAAFLVGPAWQWRAMTPGDLAIWLNVPSVRLDRGRAVAAFLLLCLPGAINAYGLVRIRSSFLCFARGQIFSPQAILGLQSFGSAGAISVLAAAVMTPVIGCWLTYDTGAGADFPLRIGTGSLTILVMSGFTWIFARILGVAAAVERKNRELSDENAAFV